MARVLLRNLTKRFGTMTAVRNVDLEIADGEFFVLVGPSGCGKTTILRLIAGLEEPSAGEIYIGDRPVSDLSPRERDVAMVFQNYALYPHLNVYNNIAFGLQMRRISRSEIDRRVNEMAQLLGIADRLSSKPRELSGGQKQRVALGRALVRNPQIFLLDEPLSNLDAKLRLLMRAELQELHRHFQTTTLYVTHDQIEAMTLGERVAVMHTGVIQQIDHPQRLYEQPANLFVASFIGSPPMNLLRARSFADSGALGVEGQSFRWRLPDALAALVEDARREVIVGIRPEHLRLATTGEAMLRMRIQAIEPLGHETIIYGRTEDGAITVRLNAAHLPHSEEELALDVDLKCLKLFDAQTGLSLTIP